MEKFAPFVLSALVILAAGTLTHMSERRYRLLLSSVVRPTRRASLYELTFVLPFLLAVVAPFVWWIPWELRREDHAQAVAIAYSQAPECSVSTLLSANLPPSDLLEPPSQAQVASPDTSLCQVRVMTVISMWKNSDADPAEGEYKVGLMDKEGEVRQVPFNGAGCAGLWSRIEVNGTVTVQLFEGEIVWLAKDHHMAKTLAHPDLAGLGFIGDSLLMGLLGAGSLYIALKRLYHWSRRRWGQGPNS